MKKDIDNLLTENKFLILSPSVDDIDNNKLMSFYKLWLEKNTLDSLPDYEYFSSVKLDDHIDDIAFLKFEPNSHRFKIMRMGKNVIEVLGGSILGEYWDSLPGSEEGQARMSWAAENKLPYYVGWPVYNWADKENKNYSSISCPLFDKDENVEMLAMAFAWEKD